MADTQTPSDSIPLTTRVGTQIFELRPSCDAFTEEFIDQSPLGHVLFDASAGSLCVNDQQISEVFWNDVGNSVGWVSSTAHLCEGHLWAVSF
ncbi:uncharacterized protein PHACADRAFT_261983 [Phanerochaete carnosa HHB-10118-sp]|uniref:Uncharacterized protein n=1 Tax=Phanerochaete carnosa (strain HHB-10118-sp) TaxID=650164 RepID=K5VXZ1_PHACS|nr:uncharacterized protein PHACADRAFT_261983 [Phanerochaete carnosa HHB-10118-sp]EKM51690.1 hypothetical protein PHACADRAFT_261983 [Phanerochaete carnosa HHB-10118-sp]